GCRAWRAASGPAARRSEWFAAERAPLLGDLDWSLGGGRRSGSGVSWIGLGGQVGEQEKASSTGSRGSAGIFGGHDSGELGGLRGRQERFAKKEVGIARDARDGVTGCRIRSIGQDTSPAGRTELVGLVAVAGGHRLELQ